MEKFFGSVSVIALPTIKYFNYNQGLYDFFTKTNKYGTILLYIRLIRQIFLAYLKGFNKIIL